MKTWKKVRLEDICRIEMGKTPSRDDSTYWGEGTAWLSIADMKQKFTSTSKETITSKAAQNCNCRLVKPGTLLMSFKLSIGKLTFNTVPLYTNEAIVALPIIDETQVSKYYLYYALQSINLTEGTDKAAKGLTLNKEKLKNIKIPLPPLAEQIHIAQVMDQTDRLRQQDRQLLAHYDQLVQAVFVDMFGSANPESKDWAEVKIAELAKPTKNSMRTGPFGSDLLHSEFVEEGIFVLGIDNVVNNCFEWAKPRFITTEKYEKLKRYTVFPGDVLISIMATIGRTAVVPEDVPAAINSKHLAAISLNQDLAVPEFISYSLYADPKILRQLASQSKGAIMDGLNLGIIKNTKLNLPPLKLQRKFTTILAAIEAQKAVVKQLQLQSEALFNSLLQQAFRGELTRPEPAELAAAGQLRFAL